MSFMPCIGISSCIPAADVVHVTSMPHHMGQVRPSHMCVRTDLLSRQVMGLTCCRTPFRCAVLAGWRTYAWTLCSMLHTKSISLSWMFIAAVMTECAHNVLDRIYTPGSWQHSLDYSHVNPVFLSCNSSKSGSCLCCRSGQWQDRGTRWRS